MWKNTDPGKRRQTARTRSYGSKEEKVARDLKNSEAAS